MISERSYLLGQNFVCLSSPLDRKEKGAEKAAPLDHFAQFMQELEPRVERHAQTERFLARCSLSAL